MFISAFVWSWSRFLIDFGNEMTLSTSFSRQDLKSPHDSLGVNSTLHWRHNDHDRWRLTSLTVVYSTVYWDADLRKHQSSASLAFVWGIHRDRWIPRAKGQLRGKCFQLMTSSWWHMGARGHVKHAILAMIRCNVTQFCIRHNDDQCKI